MKSLKQVLTEVTLPFELAPLQAQDIEALAPLERIAFFYEVGVGKTVCASLVSLMWARKRNFVVVPPILIDDWVRWLEGLGVKGVVAYRSPQRTVSQLYAHYVVMSHAIFRDDHQKIIFSLRGDDAAFIIDEAAALKNPSSKLFRLVNTLSVNRPIVLLTGTPTTTPADAYAYIKIKTPTVYRSVGMFENLHVASRDIFKRVTGWHDLARIGEALMLQSVRRDKKEMFGYDKQPHFRPIPYSLDKAHKRLYDKLMEEQLLIYSDGTKIDATSATKLYHASQQIIANYGFYSGDASKRSATYDLIDQTLDEVQPMELGNSKLVIWTIYQKTSAAVFEYLTEKLGAKAVVAAYGASNSRKAVDRIMDDPATRVLVGQPGSCGVGLNLHHVCSQMLFVEMSTSPMQVRQAIGRVDRNGQTVHPTIRFGQAIGTIQETLFRNLLKNADLVQQVELAPKSLRQEIFGE